MRIHIRLLCLDNRRKLKVCKNNVDDLKSYIIKINYLKNSIDKPILLFERYHIF